MTTSQLLILWVDNMALYLPNNSLQYMIYTLSVSLSYLKLTMSHFCKPNLFFVMMWVGAIYMTRGVTPNAWVGDSMNVPVHNTANVSLIPYISMHFALYNATYYIECCNIYADLLRRFTILLKNKGHL